MYSVRMLQDTKQEGRLSAGAIRIGVAIYQWIYSRNTTIYTQMAQRGLSLPTNKKTRIMRREIKSM